MCAHHQVADAESYAKPHTCAYAADAGSTNAGTVYSAIGCTYDCAHRRTVDCADRCADGCADAADASADRRADCRANAAHACADARVPCWLDTVAT